MSKFFNEADLKKIEEAVKHAESEVSGEIVPVFVEQSGDYEQGKLRAGVSLAALVTAVWMVFYEFGTGWQAHWVHTPEALALFSVVGFCMGFFVATYVPVFRMLFILKKEKAETVDTAARLAFLDEEVFATRNRTGILIYISRLEHQVEILGDKTISANVSVQEWEHILQTIVTGIKQRRKTEAICQAVEQAKHLLIKNGHVADGNDTNELPNNLRIR